MKMYGVVEIRMYALLDARQLHHRGDGHENKPVWGAVSLILPVFE
jgi:hypothetical protein